MNKTTHEALRKIREAEGINKSEMARRLGIASQLYGRYESGEVEPKIDFKRKIKELFNVDLIDFEQKSSSIKMNVFNFESAGAAGEAMILLNEDKYKQQPDLYLPDLGHGKHILTPVKGDSMHSTIKDGDKVLSTYVEDKHDIHQGYIYAILDKNDGLVYKRLYKDGNMWELWSDNETYKPYKRHSNELLAIFKVRQVHTTDLRPYFDDVRKEMRDISRRMHELERIILSRK